MRVTVAVAVGVLVEVAVAVGVGVEVAVTVGVLVGVGVAVAVFVTVGVGVAVDVLVGEGAKVSMTSPICCAHEYWDVAHAVSSAIPVKKHLYDMLPLKNLTRGTSASWPKNLSSFCAQLASAAPQLLLAHVTDLNLLFLGPFVPIPWCTPTFLVVERIQHNPQTPKDPGSCIRGAEVAIPSY